MIIAAIINGKKEANSKEVVSSQEDKNTAEE
jgi:hypothetical protein